jgi:hypothetical protein
LQIGHFRLPTLVARRAHRVHCTPLSIVTMSVTPPYYLL